MRPQGTVSDDHVQSFKKNAKKEFGHDLTDEEAREGLYNLVGFFKTLDKIDKKIKFREKRLKEFPDGYSLPESDGKYNCKICYSSVSGEETWYDKYGFRCMDCERNIKNGVISPEIIKDQDSWVSGWDLKNKYELHHRTVAKLKRDGELIGRDLIDSEGNVYFSVYMLEENQTVIDKRQL